MRLILALAAALATALFITGWLPVDRLPSSLGGIPTPMVFFVLMGVMVLAILATAGRSRRL
jgi:hypothetical protein